jgi:hypothetical protein
MHRYVSVSMLLEKMDHRYIFNCPSAWHSSIASGSGSSNPARVYGSVEKAAILLPKQKLIHLTEAPTQGKYHNFYILAFMT